MTSSDPAPVEALPSLTASPMVTVRASAEEASVKGVLVAPEGALPEGLGLGWDDLTRRGFEGGVGQTLVLPASGHDLVLVGSGPGERRTAAVLRDVVAAFVRAVPKGADLTLDVGEEFPLDPVELGTAVTEAALLARYSFQRFKTDPTATALESFTLVTPLAPSLVALGIDAGRVYARACAIARDLGNAPASHLTATDLADLAAAVGPAYGLVVEIADRAKLQQLGCGGILGVNAGSAEEPRMIVLDYQPEGWTEGAPHVALVGKGIMYDSGGISLKPSDPMHLLMKIDMGGAAAVFGAMTALRDLGARTRVTGWLMCTDNMPSGTATKLGDVLTIRGGTTVEVKNTDAEGRLVMSDALVLAAEQSPTAIIDIATLTGAALMALGSSTAAAFGTDQRLVDRVLDAAAAVDEPAWQLPLERRYRPQLDSDIADIANLGGRFAGATTAALFLAEFVGDIPWAHLDIAGTMQSESDESWRSKGATGYGARLLARLLVDGVETEGGIR